jgi:hypothetical protein
VIDIVAESTSIAVLPLLRASPARSGLSLGRGYIEVDGVVLAITALGSPRMPNGMTCELRVGRGERVRVGDGVVVTSAARVRVSSLWDPTPCVRFVPRAESPFKPDPSTLAGRGAGLTPAGDDLLAGYVAGLTLFLGARDEALAIAERAAPRTTSLSATLLRHAARGELPEPAHALLARGDARPLRAFGHSSGTWLLAGLALAGARCPRSAATTILIKEIVALPDLSAEFQLDERVANARGARIR